MGTPSKLKGYELNELSFSRTGKGLKAKKNNKENGATEGAKLVELRAILVSHPRSIIPPTPQKDDGAGGAADDGPPCLAELACPACGHGIELCADDEHDLRGDYYVDNDLAYCRYCQARIEELDEDG